MPTYLVDTNFFFECKKAADLPWHELEGVPPGKAGDVILVVPSPVVLEIERHKSKGAGRTAKRAREASATLREAVKAPGRTIDVRSTTPKVTVALPPPVRGDFTKFPNLDPSKADHRIAVEFIELLPVYPDLAILTDDTLLALTVGYLGYKHFLVPDNWKLAPENDERDAEIIKLREENRALKQNYPVVDFTVMDGLGAVDCIKRTIPLFTLDNSQIQESVDIIKRHFPMKTNFAKQTPQAGNWSLSVLSGTWYPAKDEEIDEYKSEYSRWIISIEKWMPTCAELMNEAERQFEIGIHMTNAGFVNADNVRLKLSGYDGIELLASAGKREREKDETARAIRLPPKAPKGRFLDHNWLTSHTPETFPRGVLGLDSLYVPERDPNKFYVTGGKPTKPVTELELTCRALPHQSEPCVATIRAVVSSNALGQKPRVKVRVEASNLRTPVEKFINFAIDFEARSITGAIEVMCQTRGR